MAHVDLSGVGVGRYCESYAECGLASYDGPAQRQEIAASDIEIDPIEHQLTAVVEAEPANLDPRSSDV